MRKTSLRALRTFLQDTGAPYGLLINSSDKVELLAANIIRIPATHL